jgi:hypothetical protein
MMPGNPSIRASDDDRDRTARLLGEHHAAGRLTADEFAERMEKAYAAKTIGELDSLLEDLPGIDIYRLPHDSLPRYRGSGPGAAFSASLGHGGLGSRLAAWGPSRLSPVWRAAWACWLSTSLVCFVIWAIAGAGYPWPLWVAGPWGAILAARWITGSHPGGGPGHGGRGGCGAPGGPGSSEAGRE